MTSSAIILGANAETAPLVICAQTHFDQVHVVDPYPSSFCKKIEGVIPLDLNPLNIDEVADYCVVHEIECVFY